MTTTTTRTYYINRKNGKAMEVISEDTKCGTVNIRFMEDGKVTKITAGTFKRWYKKVEEEVTVDAPETVAVATELEELAKTSPATNYYTEDEALENAVVDPDTCADGRTYAEIGKEIAAQAKAKASKAKAAKKPATKKAEKPAANNEARNAFLAKLEAKVAELGCEIKTWAGVPDCNCIKYGKATVLEVYARKNGYVFYAKPFVEELVADKYTYNLVNYYLAVVVKGVDFSDNLVFDVMEKTISAINGKKSSK